MLGRKSDRLAKGRGPLFCSPRVCASACLPRRASSARYRRTGPKGRYRPLSSCTWPQAPTRVRMTPMIKPYLVSLAVGLLVGIIYALFQVRSPAPPVIALVGLLGILVGEQLPPLGEQLWTQES